MTLPLEGIPMQRHPEPGGVVAKIAVVVVGAPGVAWRAKDLFSPNFALVCKCEEMAL